MKIFIILIIIFRIGYRNHNAPGLNDHFVRLFKQRKKINNFISMLRNPTRNGMYGQVDLRNNGSLWLSVEKRVATFK